MYIKKTCGCVLGKLSESITVCKGLLDVFIPETAQSTVWKYWRAILDPKLCADCLSHHGKIYTWDEIPEIEPPLHDNCAVLYCRWRLLYPAAPQKTEKMARITGWCTMGIFQITIFRILSCGRLAGKTESRPSDMHRGRCISVESMIMMTVTCLLLPDASGMKQTSITMKDAATGIESCILTTV